MVIIPQSDVILLKSPLELNQAHQLNFRNANEQYNYFNSLPKRVVGNDFTYVRKDSILSVEGVVDNFYAYNYVMYRNHAYSNKWFYAFIDKVEYVNDNCTYIYISTDVFQSWQFDLNYKQCFVEREHVNDDGVGKHTIPEGLEIGEYQIVDLRDIPLYDEVTSSDKWIPCFCVTALPEGCEGAVDGRVKGDNGLIGGVFNSLKFFSTHTMNGAKQIISAYESGSVSTEAIINVYMIPRCCANQDISSPTTWHGFQLYPLRNYFASDEYSLQQPTVLAGNYRPRNKKLYSAPFSYVYMSNNAGEDIELKWEDFPVQRIGNYTMPTINYYKYLVPSASISGKLLFTNYKNYASDTTTATQMVNYGINYAKVPVCAWTTDYYTNWLTQNGINTQVGLAEAGIGLLGSVAVGSMLGGVGGAVALTSGIVSAGSQVMNTMAEQERASKVPPQSHGNTSTGDLVYALKRNSISCYFMSIRPEIASVVDSYFDMYGYKVNAVKVPNVNGRYNWNYIKTIGCYIEADIPQEDLQKIKDMFNNGITIWHHANSFMNYNQSNPIV